MEGSGTTFRGSGAFGGDNRLRQLDIERLTFGRTDVAGRLAWQGRDLAVSLSGRSIDFTDLLARENETPPPPAGTPPPPAGPKLTISAKVDKVILKAGQELVAVSARAENDGSSWRAATIEAKVGATPVSAVLLPYERGRELTVLTGDAGAVLKGLGITEYLLGGRLRFVAKFLDTAPVERTLGHLEIDEYRVVKAPVLAELLAVASVAGIPELLTGEGIAFSTLTADFVRGPSLIEVTEARAAGLAMGLTLQGTIRRSDDVVDLTGRIVPIYALNRMIGSIPLLGDILTGGPGGGLIAFTYSVKGPLDNPQISVNPLSGLAPGFLRNLFFERRQPGPSGSTDPQGSGTSQSGTPTSAMTPQGARQ
jgi:hypothetical protein